MNAETTNPADDPVLRDVVVEVRHDAEYTDAQVSDGKVHQEEVDVIAHLAVAQDDEYHQQIACSQQTAMLARKDVGALCRHHTYMQPPDHLLSI